MAPHVSHVGVHDHGFNNISTYGNLRRLMNEGRIAENEWERRFYELALKYYYQAIRDAPYREDYATRWGDRLLDAYVNGTPPPPPWKGAWSE